MAVEQAMEEQGRGATGAQRGGTGRLVLMALAAVVLVGASVGGTLVMTGMFDERGASAAQVAGSADERPAAKRTPVYVEFGEPFVVNFIEDNQIRYLQVRIEGMTRDATVPDQIARHLPRIRNNLVFMFSGFDYDSLGTVSGKQRIRDEALAEVQAVLREETGSEGIEELYFTSFVMQ